MNSFLRLCRLARLGVAAALLGGLSLLPLSTRAQGRPGGGGFLQDGQQRVEALRVSFITSELKLTPDEAKTFWPVYEAREAELKKARRDMMVERFETQLNFDSMSDADLERAMDAMLAFQQQEVDITKKYHLEFKKVLGVRRTALFYRAEQRFKRELLRRLRQGGGPGANR